MQLAERRDRGQSAGHCSSQRQVGWLGPIAAKPYKILIPGRTRLHSAHVASVPALHPRQLKVAPSGPQWLHEIKHDGYRLMARRIDDKVRLITRGGYDWTKRYPLIVKAASALKVRSATIDGEAVVCGLYGASSSCTAGTMIRRSSCTRSTCWSWTARTCARCHLRSARRSSPSLCGERQSVYRLHRAANHAPFTRGFEVRVVPVNAWATATAKPAGASFPAGIGGRTMQTRGRIWPRPQADCVRCGQVDQLPIWPLCCPGIGVVRTLSIALPDCLIVAAPAHAITIRRAAESLARTRSYCGT